MTADKQDKKDQHYQHHIDTTSLPFWCKDCDVAVKVVNQKTPDKQGFRGLVRSPDTSVPQPQDIELDTVIDNFIKKWCGENAPHLLDTDENDGQRLKSRLQKLLHSQRQAVIDEVLSMPEMQDEPEPEVYGDGDDEWSDGHRKGGNDAKYDLRAAIKKLGKDTEDGGGV